MTVPEAYGAVKSVALGVLGCCLEQASDAAGDDLRTDVTQLSWQSFPLVHEMSRTANDVDVLATMREVLVAGLGAQLPSPTTARRRAGRRDRGTSAAGG
jgi:hypothetical protein